MISVVSSVRDLPGEKRHKKRRVREQTYGVVEEFVLGERAVTAFVTDDPESSEDETLHNGVGGPENKAEVRVVGERIDLEGEVDEDGGIENVARSVRQGPECRGIEAIGWDRVSYLLEGQFLLLRLLLFLLLLLKKFVRTRIALRFCPKVSSRSLARCEKKKVAAVPLVPPPGQL